MKCVKYSLPLIFIYLASCGSKKQKVDLLILGPTIYSIDDDSSVFSAMAINGDTIFDLGAEKDFSKKYTSDNILDLTGQFIYPGLIDAHSHFFGLGQSLFTVDLRGVISESEMISKVEEFYKDKNVTSIQGRGWDQNIWASGKYPTKQKLDSLYPSIPVCLKRVDGHAALVNQVALDMAGINTTTVISGGEIVKENGQITGVLIDNAVDLVTQTIPQPTIDEKREMIMRAEKHCLQYGLTTVCDAGLNKDIIDLYNEMHEAGELNIRIYAMVDPTHPTLDWLLQNGPLKTPRLNVTSVKFYMDGAMGSRGACLIEPYSDQPGHFGFLLNPIDSLRMLAKQLKDKGLQLNVHCIGDSANRTTLSVMSEVLDAGNNLRWRIEHVQLISDEDWKYFKNWSIIPSMQPTHATSDGAWVVDRLGQKRLKNAYALQTALESAGLIALGTDFPVEEVNPYFTFYAAVTRQHPQTNLTFDWLQSEKLSRYNALKGMTIWAAYAQFEENEKGSLEIGKYADFVVLDKNLLTTEVNEIPSTMPSIVFLAGREVFKRNN